MQTYPAICFVKIGLAVLLSANLIFGIAKADTHQAGVGETIFENTVLATDLADRDQAAQEQEGGGPLCSSYQRIQSSQG